MACVLAVGVVAGGLVLGSASQTPPRVGAMLSGPSAERGEHAQSSDGPTSSSDGPTDQSLQGTSPGAAALTIGTLLPRTGNLAFLGPAMVAAADLAVRDIDAAGGVLGGGVAVVHGDSGGATNGTASRTVRRLMERGADVVVGSASSAVSFMVMEQVARADTVIISPASTSADLTAYDTHRRFFRTSPSDVLQGKALGELLVDDGCSAPAVLALGGPYFTDLRSSTSKALRRNGLVADETLYGADPPRVGVAVQRVLSSSPDCIAVMAFEEVAQVLTELLGRGFGGDDETIYLVGASVDDRLGDRVDASLDSVRGIVPGAPTATVLRDRLESSEVTVDTSSFAAETYDAVIIAALAAQAAGSRRAGEIARRLPAVTRDGVRCTAYQSCSALLRSGKNIDYDGQSGAIELDNDGDPREATFRIVGYDSNAALVVTGERPVRMDQ